MSDIVLRAAQSTDAGTTGAILSAFIDETDWMPRLYTRAQDIGFAGSMIESGWVNVATLQEHVVGFMARDGVDINALYVAPQHRSKGVGAALITQAQAHNAHLKLWTFVANIRAQAFYAQHGFREIGRTDGTNNEEGLPDIQLEWRKEGL